MDGMYSAQVEATKKHNKERTPTKGDVVRYRGSDDRFYKATLTHVVGNDWTNYKASLEVEVLGFKLPFFGVRFDGQLNNHKNTWHYGDV